MSIDQLVRVLRARWLTLALSIAVCVALVAGATQFMEKKYSATATVVVDIKSADPVSGAVVMPPATANYLATQVGVINSNRVMRRVIEFLALDKDPAHIAAWQRSTGGHGDIKEWLCGFLLSRLSVRASHDGNLIDITAIWTDPAMASKVANAVARAYITTNLELKVEPAKEYANWFGERTTTSRDALEKAQIRLSEYQRSSGIVESDAKLDVENARLAELSTQLVALQGITADSASRQRQTSGNVDTLPEVMANPMVGTLKTELARMEAKREELAGRVGSAHPDMQRADSEIAALRERIAAESKRVATAIGTNNRINQERESVLRSALEAQKRRVLAITKQRDEIGFLQADVANAQRAYDLVTQRLAQTSLESQSQTANVMVVTPAVTPLRPVSPRPALNILVALMLGLLVGIAIVLVSERLDKRVRSESDLRDALLIPMLGGVSAA
ncbi:chain length determinant protein EpsF [Uliginosibacterium sp. H3]|uniref:Chain length determinant protein EpsF n=1 Tax=Uliginosibacterium silvisoli TaxID=3114758 RepID=A0ABU6K7J8_9RHOO|nr:chain length determinant protein EpsF [Uliginosibacterium sp. H3]